VGKVITHVFLDDNRPCPDERWTLVNWPQEAIDILKTGNVTHLSLDHDLGNDRRGKGYDVILWIEKQVATNDFKPPKVMLAHSSNESAKLKMRAGIRAIRKIYNQKLKEKYCGTQKDN